MKRLKVKYCYSEEEANKFLATLALKEGEPGIPPVLHNIQYCARLQGDSTEYNSEVIAIIQYFVHVFGD